MIGTVESYEEKSKIGYIIGFDEDMYIFRDRDIKGEEKLKKGDIVKFTYTLRNLNEMPLAEMITKENL